MDEVVLFCFLLTETCYSFIHGQFLLRCNKDEAYKKSALTSQEVQQLRDKY